MKKIEKILVVTGDDLPTTYARMYLNNDQLVVAVDTSKKDPNDHYGIPEGSEFLVQTDYRKSEIETTKE